MTPLFIDYYIKFSAHSFSGVVLSTETTVIRCGFTLHWNTLCYISSWRFQPFNNRCLHVNSFSFMGTATTQHKNCGGFTPVFGYRSAAGKWPHPPHSYRITFLAYSYIWVVLCIETLEIMCESRTWKGEVQQILLLRKWVKSQKLNKGSNRMVQTKLFINKPICDQDW